MSIINLKGDKVFTFLNKYINIVGQNIVAIVTEIKNLNPIPFH